MTTDLYSNSHRIEEIFNKIAEKALLWNLTTEEQQNNFANSQLGKDAIEIMRIKDFSIQATTTSTANSAARLPQAMVNKLDELEAKYLTNRGGKKSRKSRRKSRKTRRKIPLFAIRQLYKKIKK